MMRDDEACAPRPIPRVGGSKRHERDQRAADEHRRRLADTAVERERDVSIGRITCVESRGGDDDPGCQQQEQCDQRQLHHRDEVAGERQAAEQHQRHDAAAQNGERGCAIVESRSVELRVRVQIPPLPHLPQAE